MMKKIIIAIISLVFILNVLFVNVYAEDFPILDRQVETRQTHLEWITSVQETRMETIIEYIDEISNGTGTSELSSLLNDFKDQTAKIETLTTHIALNNLVRQLISTSTDFKIENLKQMNEYNGKILVLLGRIAAALKDNKEELDKLKNIYWETFESNTLEIFDIRIERAQTVLNKLENMGYNISEAQKKLDEIKSKRSELEAALKERDGIKVLSVQLEILDLSRELAQIVKDLQVKLPLEKIVRFWINLGDRVVERTDTIISELETLGFDVAELRTIHSKAETDLQRAKDEFTIGNLEGALDALRELRIDLLELKEAYLDLVFGEDIPEDTGTRIDAIISALDDTVGKMEKSIGLTSE